MGWDIHLFVESPGKAGWSLVEPEPVSCYCEKEGRQAGCGICTDPDSPDTVGKPGKLRAYWYDTRCSELFAALGLPDVHDELGIEPISKSRGFPADISAELRSLIDLWAEGNALQASSWLSLSELQEWSGWNRRITTAGFVTGQSLVEKRSGKPWSFSVKPGSLPVVEREEMEKRIAQGADSELDTVATKFELSSTLSTRAAIFLESLEKIEASVGSDVRLVFFFSN